MAYTIDIINQAAGTSYVYDILSLNAYIIQQGGTGGHTYRIDALNELCTIAGANAGWNYEIDALNAISTAIGGTGNYTYEYEAWTEIAGIGFNPYDFITDPDFISNLKGLKTSGAFTYMEDIVGTNDAKLVKSLCTNFSTTGYVSTTNSTIKDNFRHMDGMVTTLEFSMKCDAVVPEWVDHSYNTIIGCGGYSTSKRGFIVGFAPNVGNTANRFKVTVASDTNLRTMTFATNIDLNWHKYKIVINTTALTSARV